MARILILIVLAWILYQIIKRVLANINAQNSTQKPEGKLDENILQCAQCGCHVPETDSQMINEQIVCSNPECQHTQSKKAHSNQAKSDKPDHGD